MIVGAELAAREAAVETLVLPSGLRVLVRPMEGYSSVHAILAVRCGSADRFFTLNGESFRMPMGTAHYLEHKMFEDTDGDAFVKFAALGADANAYTAFDRTCYLFTATESIDESLNVLLEMAAHPYFTEQTIAKEQGIIGQEIRMYEDSPDWRLYLETAKCLYHGHPIREDIAGTVESIAGITPEQLYTCCRAFYRPENMVLAAAGKITKEQVVDACRRCGFYDAAPAVSAEKQPPEEPMTVLCREKRLSMPVSLPYFGVGFKEKPVAVSDLRTQMLYEFIGECISGGMSPLYRRLYDSGLINPGFDGGPVVGEGCTFFVFQGISEQPETVRDMLLEEIRSVREKGVDREIFSLCKKVKYGQLVQTLDSVSASASMLADLALVGGTLEEEVRLAASLTPEEADALMQDLFSEERMSFAVIEPQEEEGEE